MSLTPKSLTDWRKTIKLQVPYVDIKPYSHNIIGLALGAIDKIGGVKEVNRAIEDFGLVALGWNRVAKENKE